MRVSAAGWLYDSLERTREVARATANVTHNHPEGIKGAEATASAIYMARNSSSKEEIKEYIEREFHYNLDRTLDEIRPGYHMDETCQRTVPEAIIAFLESHPVFTRQRNSRNLYQRQLFRLSDFSENFCLRGHRTMALSFYGRQPCSVCTRRKFTIPQLLFPS